MGKCILCAEDAHLLVGHVFNDLRLLPRNGGRHKVHAIPGSALVYCTHNIDCSTTFFVLSCEGCGHMRANPLTYYSALLGGLSDASCC